MTKLNKRKSILEILQSRLDSKYGKGIFRAAKILLLFGCMFTFSSCVSEGSSNSSGEGGGNGSETVENRNAPSRTEGANGRRSTTAGTGAKITIERTGQTANPELPFDTDEPFVIDAFFAEKLETEGGEEEEKPRYREIKNASIGETVYVFVDTINLEGKNVNIKILDKEGYLTKGVKMDKVLFKDSSDGVFSAKVGEEEDNFAIFEVCLRHKEEGSKDDLTKGWRGICAKNKAQFAIEVNVDAENVIYCGLNNEEDEKANIWLNQDGMWFKIIERVTIVIDPGHGGKDPGVPAYKGTRHEKEIVLIVSLLLREKLNQELMDEVRVVMTRETDIYVGGATATQKESLRERVRIAKNNEADVFISIHVDSAGYEDDKGKVHYNENADHAIVFSAKSSNAESTILKNNIAVSLSEVVVPLQNVRQEEKGYGVLNGHVSKTGAVLVEIGFITNKVQEDLMNEESNLYLTSIANKLAEGIINTIQQ